MTSGETTAQSDPESAAATKIDPASLVLRAQPAGAIRFKRGLIVALLALASAAAIATAWFALEPRALHFASADEDPPAAASAPSEALSSLPKGYADVPKLGPPLPGDLGGPILRQQQKPSAPSPDGLTPADDRTEAARQQRASELKAARSSGLFASSDSVPVAPARSEAAPDSVAPSARSPSDPDKDANAQEQKAAFLAGNDTTSGDPHRLSAPPSPYTLSAGTVIPASLITGLRSDLPGLVTAQVTERVFDSATGTIELIPQGARLIGKYDSVIAFGQRRALVVWQRILLPNGSSLPIYNVSAADPSGYAGLADRVDFHTWALLKGAAVSTLLGIGSGLTFSDESDLVRAIRESGQQSVSRAGDQLTSRNLQVQPTITIRPGARVLLVVNHDLVLKPWKE